VNVSHAARAMSCTRPGGVFLGKELADSHGAGLWDTKKIGGVG
jgi:hypothetical protein